MLQAIEKQQDAILREIYRIIDDEYTYNTIEEIIKERFQILNNNMRAQIESGVLID